MLVEEVTAYVVDTAKELELKMESENLTELLKSHDKIVMDEELLVMDKLKKGFLLLVRML